MGCCLSFRALIPDAWSFHDERAIRILGGVFPAGIFFQFGLILAGSIVAAVWWGGGWLRDGLLEHEGQYCFRFAPFGEPTVPLRAEVPPDQSVDVKSLFP